MAAKYQPPSCSMCLELFEKPKILPCFHTFCERCLQDLATRNGGKSFPCPHCRKNTPVPKDGVSGFQDNFYIDQEIVEQLQSLQYSKRFMCDTHPKNELISYCMTCHLAICVECMLGLHKPHQMEVLSEVSSIARQQLSDDKERLDRTLTKIGEKTEQALGNKYILEDAVQSVRAEIHTKFAQLLSLAEKHRDDELARLESVARKLDTYATDAVVLDELKDNETNIIKMQESIEQALQDGGDLELILLAKEMKFGCGSEQCLQAMMPKDWPRPPATLPVLKTSFSLDADISLVQSIIGNVTTIEAAQVHCGVYSMLDKIKSALMFS